MDSRFFHYPGGSFNRYYRVDPTDFFPRQVSEIISRPEWNRRQAIIRLTRARREMERERYMRVAYARELTRRHRRRYGVPGY